MLPKRMKISKGAGDALRMLKGRTGLTPNIVCRMALLLSLEDGDRGGTRGSDHAGNEFNAPTLFGEHSLLLECLIREVHGPLDSKQCASVIASHIDAGLDRLRKSKSLLEMIEYSGLSAKQ